MAKSKDYYSKREWERRNQNKNKTKANSKSWSSLSGIWDLWHHLGSSGLSSPTFSALLELLFWDISTWFLQLSSMEVLALLTSFSLHCNLAFTFTALFNGLSGPSCRKFDPSTNCLALAAFEAWYKCKPPWFYNACIFHAWKTKWTVWLRSATSSRCHLASFWHSNSCLCVPWWGNLGEHLTKQFVFQQGMNAFSFILSSGSLFANEFSFSQAWAFVARCLVFRRSFLLSQWRIRSFSWMVPASLFNY